MTTENYCDTIATQQKESRLQKLKESYQYFYDKGIVKNKSDFAEKVGVNRATMYSAFSGNETYLTSALIAKVNNALADLEKEEDMPTLLIQDTIPVIPASARAGSLGEFAECVREYDCEKMVTPIKGADYAIQVTGESMSPEYPNGSYAIIKRVDTSFIPYGNVFVLDTTNGAVIKQVFPTDDPSVVECRSINPMYPPFKVPMTSILGWYRVLMMCALK